MSCEKAPVDAGGRAQHRAGELLEAWCGQLQQGDASCLDQVCACAGQATPQQAVTVLEAAAAGCDESAIQRLYEAFGAFEFATSALVRAIASGNVSSARALTQRGVTLQPSFDDAAAVDGESAAQRTARRRTYLDVNLSSDIYRYHVAGKTLRYSAANFEGYAYRMCITSDGVGCAEALCLQADLPVRDVKGLCLAAAIAGDFDLAQRLLACGAAEGGDVAVEVVRRGGAGKVRVRELGDLLHPGCGVECARFVCANAAQQVPQRWNEQFVEDDPQVVRLLVSHLRQQDVANPGALLRVLAANGFDAEVSSVLTWEPLDPAAVQRALEAAADADHAECVAMLLHAKRSIAGAGGARSSLRL